MHISLGAAVASCALVLLTGCTGVSLKNNTTQTNSSQGAAIQGRVHGGQNPISGAHVYLYAVNTTGYGKASISLLTSGTGQDANGYYVTSDSNGNFSISNDYTCPNSYSTYLVATGGNPGAGANSAITLVAPVKDCQSTDFEVVNEVSTVVLVYAFAGFITDPFHVAGSGSTLSLMGMSNAGHTVGEIYDRSTGVAYVSTPSGAGLVPQAEIDTLANILAACVNSTGPGSTACTTLFSNAKNGAAAPTDTAMAMVNIAHNPATNISTLFGLQTADSPFQPVLSAAPNDFTVAINYTGAGIAEPYGLAIDGNGNVWVADQQTNSLNELLMTNTGVQGHIAWSSNSPIAGNGLDVPKGVAIDSSGNIWVANYSNNSLSKFTSIGAAASGSPFSGNGLDQPQLLAIDKSGDVWVTNATGSGGDPTISRFTSSGSAASGSPISALAGPFAIAFDISGNAWTTNPGQYTVSEFNSSGTMLSPAIGWGNGSKMSAPNGFGIDASGNLWIADGNLVISALSEYTPSTATPPVAGTWSTASPVEGGGLSWPLGIAIDGAGNVWASNNYNSYAAVSAYSTASSAFITPASGFITKNGAAFPASIAVDPSGNVWVACEGTTGTNGTLTQYVGAATPLVTPIVANLMSPYGSSTVNKP